MWTITDICLAIIAATGLVVMVAAIAVTVRVLGAIKRAQDAFSAAMPTVLLLLADARTMTAQAERMMETVTKAHATLQSTLEGVEQVRQTADRAIKNLVLPVAATWAATIGALRSLVPAVTGVSESERREERTPPRTDWSTPATNGHVVRPED